MSTTRPIKNKISLEKVKDYYKKENINIRNYAMIIICLNTALRINDILHLTNDMVYFKGKVRDHIILKERKTGKENRVLLNKEVKMALLKYQIYLKEHPSAQQDNPYLFPSPQKANSPLSRFQAYRIICKAGIESGIEEHISCHSLRKTFGYYAWKQGKDHVVIMHIYNHSSFEITKRYLCIDEDEKDKIYQELII